MCDGKHVNYLAYNIIIFLNNKVLFILLMQSQFVVNLHQRRRN
jgi:hypothetical protein